MSSLLASAMARFILDLLRLTPSPDQHANPDEDHGQRQPLSHRQVQRKKPKEIIGLPEELDREAKAAVADEEHSRDSAQRSRLGRIDPQDHEQEHALERELIQLRGMSRQRTRALENHAPAHVGDAPGQLAVDEVAQPSRGEGERAERREKIRDLEPAQLVLSRHPPYGEQHAEKSPVKRHSAAPNRRNLEEIGEVESGLVEEHVAEPPAKHHAEHSEEEQVVELRVAHAAG